MVAVTVYSSTAPCAGAADVPGFDYPCYVVNSHDPDGDGLYGMSENGQWYVPVDPNLWLIGPPPTEETAVALPTDHWIELQFRGPLVDGPGYDIEILERGRVGEQALVFLTDARQREYLLTRITADDSGGNYPPSRIRLDIAELNLPFEPRAIRLVGLDKGGGCYGFDVQSVTARIWTKSDSCATCCPVPVDGARGVPLAATLIWSSGIDAGGHVVYFGTSPNDVHPNAEPASVPPAGQDVNSFDPGPLKLDTTYYWRVDQVNADDTNPTCTGDVWSFHTVAELLVDGFEQYHSNSNLWPSWTGSLYGVSIGLNNTEDLARTGRNSLRISYDIVDPQYYDSTFTRTFAAPQNWAGAGVETMDLFFRGGPDNGTAVQMQLNLSDGQGTTSIPYTGDPNNLAVNQWQRWSIDLGKHDALDLTTIESLQIEFLDTDPNSSATDNGVLYFDDISLYPSRCLPESRPAVDLTGDCIVDYLDLDEFTERWLDSGYYVLPVAAPNAPNLWYQFEGNAVDSGTSGRNGQIDGDPRFSPGIHGQAIRFDGKDDAVRVLGAQYLFAGIQDAITITFWQQDCNAVHDRDTLCSSDFEYGVKNPTVAVNLGCWKSPGRYFWQCGSHWSFDSQIAGQHRSSAEHSGRWNHWAFTKQSRHGADTTYGTMHVYLNGMLIDRRNDSRQIVGGVESFTIGSGWYGGYDGFLDDFRIYDYALSAREIAFVATNGTGVFDLPLLAPMDFISDDIIEFRDFASLAQDWLADNIHP